jgi:TonB family protein
MRVGTTLAVCILAACLGLVPGAWAQPQLATPASDLETLIGHLDVARQHYMKDRHADARRELSAAIELLPAMRATERAQPAAGGGRQLPRAGRDVPMSGLVRRVEPEYPVEAARQGVTGQVIIDVVINKSGRVRDPRVARSVPEFDQAALNAVRAWQFARPTVNGAPGDIAATLAVAFPLRREPLPLDDIDLGRLQAERGDYTAAEIPLVRALETITRENECIASITDSFRAGLPRDIEPPRRIKDVKPTYPGIARRTKVTGTVYIHALIDERGRVNCTRILASVPLLDQAALDAVNQWEFAPVLLNGAPVRVLMTLTVNFSLQ